jgi:hypothetical protein
VEVFVMRARLLVLFVGSMLVVGLLPGSAGAISVRWEAREGAKLVDVAVGPDGSLFVVGTERRSITAAATLSKYSPGGEHRWTRHWLPSIEDSTGGIAVAVGSDGTAYLLGAVHGSCEGGGWFVRAYTPSGDLRWKYVTPGWQCRLIEAATDIAVRGDRVVVAGYTHGCCGDLLIHDGWVTAFTNKLDRRWRTDVEPPTPTPASYYDTATGVAIGTDGSVFAAGWAATVAIVEGQPLAGTPMLTKLSDRGVRQWSIRADVRVPTIWLPVAVDVFGDRVALATGIEGRGVEWGRPPATGWLGVYSTDGGLRWQRTWGGSREDATMPTGVAFGGSGRIWVAGVRRDPGDRGTDVVIRWYDPDGSLYEKLRIDPRVRRLWSGGIQAIGFGAVATGWGGDRFTAHGGRLWRLVG